ncbi:hypothetical protein AQ729_12700 [Burkholderia pseudomallei]|nr:hypothetical protein BOC36_14275 [Burkholderia pseudomallei]ARL23350.1 hypothetical protein BOC47_13875 [Burkholderia pseudomallei]KEO70613.1 hypothetical protein J103_02850 [Burkholderia pseudomallei MSHR5855]OMQ73441.1 hypothetical protein AQ713_04165 [Burkholderia pseudomallei]OMR69107.1 hypothetical protein AQ729_12700 [Burkholderia pseudomallei]
MRFAQALRASRCFEFRSGGCDFSLRSFEGILCVRCRDMRLVQRFALPFEITPSIFFSGFGFIHGRKAIRVVRPSRQLSKTLLALFQSRAHCRQFTAKDVHAGRRKDLERCVVHLGFGFMHAMHLATRLRRFKRRQPQAFEQCGLTLRYGAKIPCDLGQVRAARYDFEAADAGQKKRCRLCD